MDERLLPRDLPWLDALEADVLGVHADGRLPHVILIRASEGWGEVQLAERLALSMLGRRDAASARELAHPDLKWVAPEGSIIKVEQIREVASFAVGTRQTAPCKVIVIESAELMNVNAANALLKTLEEPPGDAVLILIAHNPSRLPATVRSRCQALNARLPDPELAVPWLVRASGSPEPAAALALEAAAGSPLRALRMLEEDAVGPYRDLTETLDSLREGRCEPAAALATLSDVDPELLWAWLSLRAAKETRLRLGCGRVARDLASLQLEADRNRGLVATPVRQDLLLQDWLIQWSRLSDQGLRQREST